MLLGFLSFFGLFGGLLLGLHLLTVRQTEAAAEQAAAGWLHRRLVGLAGIGGIGITLEKGVQLLDGQRLWELLRKELPADTLLQCKLLPELMALCINQHLEYLQQDYSSSLFSAAVNAGTSDLIFSDYDTRRQAAAFLSQLSEEPAQPLTAEFVRNPDATLSLSDDSLQAVLAAFGAQAAPTQSS